MKQRFILGIETSCDETAVSLIQVENKKNNWEIEVLSNVVASQIDIHKKWGGVYPELASRAHLETIIPVIEEALKPIRQFKILNLKFKNSVTAIAVTAGPGLIGSLLMGTEAANILAKIYRKPLIPVNHLEGHIYAAFCGETSLREAKRRSNPDCRGQNTDLAMTIIIPKTGIFPILALVVSGGHTSLILMKDHLNYEVVGQTIDDAAGEAFDKVAKILDLGYPGGPIIEKLAEKGNENAIKFPVAMPKSLDFSFSGLKTAVLYKTKDPSTGKPRKFDKADLAASFQKAVVDALILKTQLTIDKYNPKTIILSGGVSANGYLRDRFVKELSLRAQAKQSNKKDCYGDGLDFGSPQNHAMTEPSILIPPKKLSTDNAVGIAIAGALKSEQSSYVEADPNLKL